MEKQCAQCEEQYCQKRIRDDLPEGCPMLAEGCIEEMAAQYDPEEIRAFYADSLESMRRSFGRYPRIIEAVEFCRLRGYRKIGVAYCSGMLRFGRAVSEVFEREGFEVCSVGCKLGGFSPEELTGTPPPAPPEGRGDARPPRAVCNPIGQAMLLNEQGTQFNVVAGLCVGHDSLFFQYSRAPCTVVVLKDRLFPDQCRPSVDRALHWRDAESGGETSSAGNLERKEPV